MGSIVREQTGSQEHVESLEPTTREGPGTVSVSKEASVHQRAKEVVVFVILAVSMAMFIAGVTAWRAADIGFVFAFAGGLLGYEALLVFGKLKRRTPHL